MAKNKWIVVTGALLLAAIVIGFILFQQRNHARQGWQESREQIGRLNQEISALNQSVQKQKDQLSARADLIQKKQLELDTTNEQLQQAIDQTNTLRQELSALEKKFSAISNERDQLRQERQNLLARLQAMESNVAAKTAAIAALEQEVSKQNQRIIELEKEIQKQRSALAQKDKQLAALQDSHNILKSETDSLREDLYAAMDSAGKLESDQRSMKATYESLLTRLKKQLDSKEASIEEYRQKLKVTFIDQILFGFSQVRLSPEGEDALKQLAKVLATVPKGRISIVGHSDSIPIAEKYHYRFPSNWELSSTRAAAVARYLLEYGGLDPAKIEVIGRSRYQPIAQNDTKAGRAKNRRVEIIIRADLWSD